MDEIFNNYLSDLKQKSFAELSALEAHQEQKTTVNGKRFAVAIWSDPVGNSELRIVVQVYRHWFLGIGRMDVRGFVMKGDGKVIDLTRDELYEFTQSDLGGSGLGLIFPDG